MEVQRLGDPEPRYLRTCTCYLRPPRCISCGWVLCGGYCNNGMCPTPFVVQSEPIIDPLYDPELHGAVT